MDRLKRFSFGGAEECMAQSRHLYGIPELVCDTCGASWEVGEVHGDPHGPKNIAARTGYPHERGLRYPRGVDPSNVTREGVGNLCYNRTFYRIIIHYRPKRDQDDSVPNRHL